MKIVVIGNKGMLGQDLMARLQRTEHTTTGLDMPDIDICKPADVIAGIGDLAPGLIINCAAYTAVDQAETDRDAAFAVNRDGSANLAHACRTQGIPLIHISTDYVFDGNSRRPYREDDPANPLGVYGQSKWEGEQAIRSGLPCHLIIRTAWLYGVKGHNFVKTILRLAREREQIRVVADQHGCPTWTGDLADGLVAIAGRVAADANSIAWGTYHFCGTGQTTWHGFARAIVDEAGKRERLRVGEVVPITTAEYPTPAARPAWSVLECGKMQQNFGIVPRDWRQGLAAMMVELYTA